MLFAPKLIGMTALDDAALAADCKACEKIGPCGVGEKAVYMGGRWIDRGFYVPYGDIRRIFKRVALSKGGFTGKGMFGAMAYLVVLMKDGREKQSYFKREDEVDRFLARIEREHPDIPTHSEAAERKLREAEEAERARYLKTLTPEGEAAVAALREAQETLADKRALCDELAFAARQKRVIDAITPAYRYAALAIFLLGVGSAGLGAYMLAHGRDYATLFAIFGFAAIFLAVSTRVLPTGRSNKRYAQQRWDAALAALREALRGEKSFPVPPQYAHPVVLERMIRVLREGRALSVPEAYTAMKSDLKALNADVTVTQKEYDEVVLVKPLFLVCGYADEIPDAF